MTSLEKHLFNIFDRDEDYKYLFKFSNGDEFIVEYDGEGESEINPLTGEDDDYWGLVFHILEVRNNVTDNYCVDALIEISRIFYPELIVEITEWTVYRKTIIHKCIDCGKNEFAFYENSELLYICENCGEKCVTTSFLPIVEDYNEYQLNVKKNTNLSKIQMYKLRKMFNISYVELQKKFNVDFIYNGRAKDVFYKKILLEEMGLVVSVTPEANYSYEEIMYANIGRRKIKKWW